MATLRKRSLLLLKFKNFCNLAGQRMLPISEQMAYRFLLQQCSTSPCAPQSFREALMFVHGTLGADGAQESANSPHIAGRCFAKLVTKVPLKQSGALPLPKSHFLSSLLLISATVLLIACLLAMQSSAFIADLDGRTASGFELDRGPRARHWQRLPTM